MDSLASRNLPIGNASQNPGPTFDLPLRTPVRPTFEAPISDQIFDPPLGFDVGLEIRREGQAKSITLPPFYEGKDIAEHRTFFDAMEDVFRAQPFTYNSHRLRVNTTATRFKTDSEVKNRWSFLQSSATSPFGVRMSWADQKSWAYDLIALPQERETNAFAKL